ncbi:MAG: phosphoribosylglycinamide formyltransferase [Alphaproteobacteria bacterium]
MTRKRTAVLISGRGTNMSALVEAASSPSFPAEIVLVMADNPEAAGLEKAHNVGVKTATVDRRAFDDRTTFEAAMQTQLEEAGAELVCLAGFMRVLSADFVAKWFGRMINIHPSILPSFRGVDTHRRALEAGVKLHGCSVHFVKADVDAGPIIVQAAIPILPTDTPTTLSDRLLPVEHRVFPMALRLLASGAVQVDGDRVRIDGSPQQETASLIVPDFGRL